MGIKMSSVTTMDRTGKIKHRKGRIKLLYQKTSYNPKRQQPIRTGLDWREFVKCLSPEVLRDRQNNYPYSLIMYMYLYTHHLSYPQTEDEIELSQTEKENKGITSGYYFSTRISSLCNFK